MPPLRLPKRKEQVHTSNHHGYTFHHNGDYMGDILITDDEGNDLPATDVDKMIDFIKDPDAATTDLYLPIRALVAEAIRFQAIALMEQLTTDEVLASPVGQAVLED